MRLGFTLIELLVTIVLFSLLLSISLYSFRFVSINIHNINNTNPKQAINYTLLRDTISSIYSYIDTEREENHISKSYFFYFNGNEKKCRFITKSGIFTKRLSLVELRFENNTLFYYESKVFNKDINYRYLDKVYLSKKIKLLSNIRKFSFHYNNEKKSSFYKDIPSFIIIKFKKNKRYYQYKFKIKSYNKLRLKRIIFRYLER